MKQNKISILSTRPLAQTVMVKAQDKSVTIDTASFIETNNIIEPVLAERICRLALQDVSAVFTSMNAAEAVIDCLEANGLVPDWTIYSLGGITHTIIKQYFNESEIIADATNAIELATSIIEDEAEEVVFFCGNQRREELPTLLKEEDIKVNEVIVYETIETPVKIDKKYNGILFFSPSAAKSFFSINNIDADTVLFAIGTTTAQALKQLSINKVLVGALPNKEHLAENAIDYFTK
jgi:uroporphyrinogen-III synthase